MSTTVDTIIPIAGVPNEIFDINLGNTLYTLHFMFNFRGDFWSLSMLKNGAPLFYNFKLVQGVDIAAIYKLNLGGILFIRSVSGDLSDPTRADLGTDKQLIYQQVVGD